jgi:CRP-like cAMP-binding protein
VTLQVCIVLEGAVTLSLETFKGRVKVVDLLPQEIVCGGALLQRPEPCTATASVKSKLLMIPDSVFKDFLNPAVLPWSIYPWHESKL